MALLSHIPRLALTSQFGVLRCDAAMVKSRSEQLAEKAMDEQQRCRDWLLRFVKNDQPKFLTKVELRGAAMRELKVSKNSFDMAWVMAIEDTGRDDWYEPLRRRRRACN
jgi:hypothetical protein